MANKRFELVKNILESFEHKRGFSKKMSISKDFFNSLTTEQKLYLHEYITMYEIQIDENEKALVNFVFDYIVRTIEFPTKIYFD